MYGSQTDLLLSPQNASQVHEPSLVLPLASLAVDKHDHTLFDTTYTASHSGCLLLGSHPRKIHPNHKIFVLQI